MDSEFYAYIGWFLLAIFKFVLTPSGMIATGYSWTVTILTVAISSSIGFCAFYFFGDVIFSRIAERRKTAPKRFTKMNRRIVGVKMRWGLLGMGVIAGVISVPLAGLVTAKFFRDPKKALPALILAFTAWTVLLTSISWLIRNVFNG